MTRLYSSLEAIGYASTKTMGPTHLGLRGFHQRRRKRICKHSRSWVHSTIVMRHVRFNVFATLGQDRPYLVIDRCDRYAKLNRDIGKVVHALEEDLL